MIRGTVDSSVALDFPCRHGFVSVAELSQRDCVVEECQRSITAIDDSGPFPEGVLMSIRIP